MARYRRRPSVERSIGRGRLLVRHLEADRPVELAGSAPVVWNLLADTDDPEVLLDRLLDRYSDDREVIRAGMHSALGLLADSGLVEESDA